MTHHFYAYCRILAWPDFVDCIQGGNRLLIDMGVDGASLGNKGQVTALTFFVANTKGIDQIPLATFTAGLCSGGDTAANITTHFQTVINEIERLEDRGWLHPQTNVYYDCKFLWTVDGKALRVLTNRATAASAFGCGKCSLNSGGYGNFFQIVDAGIPLATACAADTAFEKGCRFGSVANNASNQQQATTYFKGQVGLPFVSTSHSSKNIVSRFMPAVLHHLLRGTGVFLCWLVAIAQAEGLIEALMQNLRGYKIKTVITQPDAKKNKFVTSLHGKELNKVLKNMVAIIRAVFIDNVDATDDHRAMGEALLCGWTMWQQFASLMTSFETTSESWLAMWLLGLSTGMVLSALVGPRLITPTLHEALQHNAFYLRGLREYDIWLGTVLMSLAKCAEFGHEGRHLIRSQLFHRATTRGGGKRRAQDGNPEPVVLNSGEDASVAVKQITDVLKKEWMTLAVNYALPNRNPRAAAERRAQRLAKGVGSDKYGALPTSLLSAPIPPLLKGCREEGTREEVAGEGTDTHATATVCEENESEDDEPDDSESMMGDDPTDGAISPVDRHGKTAAASFTEDAVDEDIEEGEGEGEGEDPEEGDGAPELGGRGGALEGADEDLLLQVQSGSDDNEDEGTALVWNQHQGSWADASAPLKHDHHGGEDLCSVKPLRMITTSPSITSVRIGGENAFEMAEVKVVLKVDFRHQTLILEAEKRSDTGPKQRIIFENVAAIKFTEDGDRVCLKVRLRRGPAFKSQYNVRQHQSTSAKASNKRPKLWSWGTQAESSWVANDAARTYSMWEVEAKKGCFDAFMSAVTGRWRQCAELQAEDWTGKPTFEKDRIEGKVPKLLGLQPGVCPVRAYPKEILSYVEYVNRRFWAAAERVKKEIGSNANILYSELSSEAIPLKICEAMICECKAEWKRTEVKMAACDPRVWGE